MLTILCDYCDCNKGNSWDALVYLHEHVPQNMLTIIAIILSVICAILLIAFIVILNRRD